ncbi:non-specific lipid-transfer protein [Acyrthosiphon pisum]|uniref:Sterol carrier protein 2 n=1 Tax=Acyrthosiphon pisum TaxID=7029 RepID=A0A8R2A4S0_ACYPI|nr:non-specific lipid-transfer protein [Acyrthosiphon pisum]|eukprot:XP_001946100.1 PREDICTED: non-specific lipid-transfer protein [Acyrthosiphon pisum]
MSKPKVYVVGVGMTKFEKPGRRDDFDYPQMAVESVTKALQDAKISIQEVDQACVGYVYGDSTCGQRALYEVGMTGIPIYNVNNNCSTGSTALYLGKQIIESQNAQCVLVLGFEKMESGSLSAKFLDRTNPMDKHVTLMGDLVGLDGAPITAQLFGNAALEYMNKNGIKPETLAKIAHKNHKHSVNNPYSQFQKEYTLNEILESPKVFGPLTKLQCCPTSDGSAAAILASEQFVIKNNLQDQAIEIVGMEMATDPPTTFSGQTCVQIVGYDMTKLAADKLFSKTTIKPEDVNVVELHDCFSANELITYEALGLCKPGKAGEFIESGSNTYGGQVVVNPSGGLISKGHPLGATGIAQCSELYWQLLGKAGKRQVPGAKVALQQNIGLGGAVVVALYKQGFPKTSQTPKTEVAKPTTDKDPTVFKVFKIFKILEEAMLDDKENIIEKVRGIYCFKVTNTQGKEGMWIIDAKNGKGSITFYGTGKPDVTFTMKDEDVVELISGKLNPQKAFFQGKIKIQGNMGLALKLVDLQKLMGHKIAELRSKL